MVLNSAGHPVIVYIDGFRGGLTVLACNDPACADGDDSVVSPDNEVGTEVDPSIALDTAGNPAVAYHDLLSRRLKVLHCGEVTCGGAVRAYGDVDDDGRVDATDALLVLQYDLARLQQLTKAVWADVNLDYLINAADALLILQLTAGLVEQFPADLLTG
jgi:hypothetical protein